MKLFYKLFRQNPDTREGIITTTSWLGILTNILIASVKVIIGTLASSVAITSEGVNNASDALTSVMTLIGTKLAGKHPDEKHPFGYGRIEYLTSLVISILILVTGTEMLIGSVKRIFHPEPMSISYISLIIVAFSGVIKFLLGLYTIKMGKKADSGALEAVGLDCRNDSFVSILTIASSAIFFIFHFSIDAYVGILTSLIILKAGIEVLTSTISELLGKPGDKDLADKLYERIRNTDGILGAADMILHNYGPDAYSGSVNIEIDHSKTIGEIYQFLHKLQLEIVCEYRVVMVFGIYAVDNDHDYIRSVRQNIERFIENQEHIKSYHAVYLDTQTDTLYCDLVVDYKQKDWDVLGTQFKEYMHNFYPDKQIELVIETEYV